jgi:L-threonylcarbamoyladenylate synthase
MPVSRQLKADWSDSLVMNESGSIAGHADQERDFSSPVSVAQETRLVDAGADGIAAAAGLLRGGELVAFPTETVYGLGADAGNAEAVARLYAAKGRPAFNPLIAHVPDLASAREQGDFNSDALALARAFWPGPLTLVVPARPACRVSLIARAGLPTLGLRVPGHPVAEALLRAVARPVVAPSANRSGRISPTRAGHVMADLAGRIAAVIDGGPCRVGVESTIVACLDGDVRLLRPGGIPRAALEQVLGRPLAAGETQGGDAAPHQAQALLAPGLLASHYAPRARVRLNARRCEPGEAYLGFGPLPDGLAGPALTLSEAGDLVEAAAHLFDHLHALDALGVGAIAVAPIPDRDLGEAINDRLRRAAAERPSEASVSP